MICSFFSCVSYDGVTHWRIYWRAPNVQKKLTKSVYVSSTPQERIAIVRRALHKFEVRRNAKIYAWWTLQLEKIFMQLTNFHPAQACV